MCFPPESLEFGGALGMGCLCGLPPIKSLGAQSLMGFFGQKHWHIVCIFLLGEERDLCDPLWGENITEPTNEFFRTLLVPFPLYPGCVSFYCTWFYCSSLCCTLKIVHFFFLNKWRFVAPLCWASPLVPFLPAAHLHFTSPCHRLVISKLSKLSHYYYVCYDDLGSVIFGVAIVIILGCHLPRPYKMVNVLWLLHQRAVPLPSSLSPGLPIPWDTTELKLGQ